MAHAGARRRRRSADLKRMDQEIRRLEKIEINESKQEKVEPLIDPFTGVRLFHIASHNLYDASILTHNMEAGYDWFVKVQRAIYRSYASLASSIQQNLKDKFYFKESDKKKNALHEADTYFSDL